MSGVSQQVIQFAINETPIGNKDGVNLVFQATEEFAEGTLQVFLSGINLDVGDDFEIGNDNKTFTIKLNPNDPTKLNVPPLQFESFRINYVKL